MEFAFPLGRLPRRCNRSSRRMGGLNGPSRLNRSWLRYTDFRMSRLLSALCASLALFSPFPAQALERQPNAECRAPNEKLAAALDGGVLVLFAPLEPSGGTAINGYIRENSSSISLAGVSPALRW